SAQPALKRDPCSRTANVALALPEVVVGGWVAVGTVPVLQGANMLGLLENLGGAARDGLGHVEFRTTGRAQVCAQPEPPQTAQPIGGSLVPDLGSEMVKRFHGQVVGPATAIFPGEEAGAVLVRH